MIRIVVDAYTEEFLGATILGPHGEDLIQIIGTAMQGGVHHPAVRDALPIHPLMAEFIPSALWSLKPLDGFLRSHVGWVMPAGGAGRTCPHSPPLLGLIECDLTDHPTVVRSGVA